MKNERWNDNELQFARLLSELVAEGLSEKMLQAVAASMDLPDYRVQELLTRAEIVFERAKAKP